MGDEYVKVPDSQILRGPDLFKTLPPQTKLFDNLSLSGSHVSELSAPFSEVVYTAEVVSKEKAKELFGKDLYTAIAFSNEFKTAMEEVKKEMIAENPDYLKIDSMVSENLEEIKSKALLLPEPSDDDSSSIAKHRFLQVPGIDYVVEKKEEEEPEDKKKDKEGKEKKKKLAKIWQDDDETLFDTMSGYWRMLSVFDEFKISPPWYNAYAEGKEHWLQTKPIPTDVFENSRNKCLNWLNKYFDD